MWEGGLQTHSIHLTCHLTKYYFPIVNKVENEFIQFKGFQKCYFNILKEISVQINVEKNYKQRSWDKDLSDNIIFDI